MINHKPVGWKHRLLVFIYFLKIQGEQFVFKTFIEIDLRYYMLKFTVDVHDH